MCQAPGLTFHMYLILIIIILGSGINIIPILKIRKMRLKVHLTLMPQKLKTTLCGLSVGYKSCFLGAQRHLTVAIKCDMLSPQQAIQTCSACAHMASSLLPA